MTINFYHSNHQLVGTLIRFLKNRNIEFTYRDAMTIKINAEDKDKFLQWCDHNYGSKHLGLILGFER